MTDIEETAGALISETALPAFVALAPVRVLKPG